MREKRLASRSRLGGHERRLLLLSLIGLGGGCHSAGLPHAASLAIPTSAATADAAVVHSLAEQESAVTQTAFEAPVIAEATAPSLALDVQPHDALFASIAQADPVADSAGGDFEAITLEELETLALTNNPTIRQLAATVQQAAGLRLQVGLRPNPIVGYQAQQLGDEGTDQHLAYIDQEIVTGGKLVLNRRVLDHTVSAQQWELEAQKNRVQTDLRVRFFEALAAQRKIELMSDFAEVTASGLELTELRRKANEASRIEVLQAKIQKNEVDLARQQAEVQLAAARKALAAIAGSANLPDVPLAGTLGEATQPVEWASTLAALIASSPEREAAEARVMQARANLRRQSVQSVPNLLVQVAGGFDNATDAGMLNLEIGAPLPVHNYNQGNIVAARAEYCRAVMEVERLEKSIQARLADVAQDYDAALAAVVKYETEILPSARETLDLAEQAYRAGEFGFLQVLIIRRTYFESNLAYLQAQTELAQANARVRGFVLTGGLDPAEDLDVGDDLRGEAFSHR